MGATVDEVPGSARHPSRALARPLTRAPPAGRVEFFGVRIFRRDFVCARCADLSLTSFAGAICSLCARLNEQELKGALATACTPRLQLLMLGYCGRGLSDAAVNATLGASDNCVPSLRELTLHGAYRLTDAGLAALLRGAPSLATLAVRRTAPLHSFPAPVS